MANNANVKRTIIEQGIVVSKEFKKATGEFKNAEGKTIGAQPDRYIVHFITGEKFDDANGWDKVIINSFKVEKGLFDRVKYNSKLEVKMEMSSYGLKVVDINAVIK